MKKNVLSGLFILLTVQAFAQYANSEDKTHMQKFIAYNCFGMGAIPADQLMIGGNHVFFKKVGFALSYRFGIRDFMEPIKGKSGDQPFLDSIRANNLFTGEQSISYAYFVAPSLVVTLTPKIPLYIGMGITKKKVYKEYQEKFDPNKYWIEEKQDARLLPTFTIGTCIPIYGRLVLNLAYDNEPRTIFVGFTIRSWDSYDEIN